MVMDQPGKHTDDAVAVLERWQGAGGTWRVINQHRDVVTVSLLQCDAETEADRLVSASPDLRRYLDGRSSSEDTR